MLTALLAGAGTGLGALLALRGLASPHPPLTRALAALQQPRRIAARDGRSLLTRRAVSLVESLGWAPSGLESDLRVVGRDLARHALDKLLATGAFVSFPILSGTLASAAGVRVPAGVVLVVAAALGVVGFFIPDALVRAEARDRRREFRHALSAYMDLVTIVIAGGGGTESALSAAASAGSGWSFAELRRALAASRLSVEPPWMALDQLGADLGVTELREVAASLALAGERGAKVRHSLATRARSLREHRLAEVETEAQAATEKMSVPVVLMLFGFVAFVLYPALQFVLDGL